MSNNPLVDRLRHHVTGAIERGEAEPIVEQRAKRDITAELEAMIDASSLLDVLIGLELVCGEKAEHIRHNWQDRALARLWDKASTVCGNAARDKRVQDLP